MKKNKNYIFKLSYFATNQFVLKGQKGNVFKKKIHYHKLILGCCIYDFFGLCLPPIKE